MAITASIAGNATPSFISIGDGRGEVAQDVITRGLRKVRVAKFSADVEAPFVDRAVLLSRAMAKSAFRVGSSRNTKSKSLKP
jgi:hypothetical protein